jgi:hypothetical protein
MRKNEAVVLTCWVPEIDCDSVTKGVDQIVAISPIAPHPLTNNSAIELQSTIRAFPGICQISATEIK